MVLRVYAMAQKGDLITGKNQNTLGGPLLSQVTGLSLETANFVYSLPSLYTGAKPILGATARLGNQVVAEGSQMASAMGYVAGELGKDVVSGYRVVRDTAIKTSVNTQLAYTDLVGKSVNGAREYVLNSIKSMGEQTPKSAAISAVATGGVKAGLETYKYLSGEQGLTSENLRKSAQDTLYATGLGFATPSMPIIPATGLGVVTDWYKDNGKYDISKTYSSNVLGNVVDKSLENSKFNTISPVVREFIINTYDRLYESKMGKKDESK